MIGNPPRHDFEEPNLHKFWRSRIGFEVSARRAFESVGFVLDGARREMIEREGRRFDLLCCGLLRAEWLARR